jgi:hypothetical protein
VLGGDVLTDRSATPPDLDPTDCGADPRDTA